MNCNGVSCIGNTSMSILGQNEAQISAVTDAVSMYDYFNQTIIPGLNNVIGTVEKGAANAGASSCGDITIGFSGSVSVDGQSYNVRVQSSSTTVPGAFGSTTVDRVVSAQTGSTATIQADLACGASTNANPLIARVKAYNPSTGSRIAAWYEKGDSKHIRILLVAKVGSTVYAGWFKTDDGDSFQIVLASAGQVYKAIGSRTVGSVKYDENGGGDTCLNATTGLPETNCGPLPGTSTITVTGIPDTLLSANTNWSAIANSEVIPLPTY